MVKNIAPPIRAFRLRLGENSPEHEVPTAGETAEPLESPSAGATISDLLPTTKLRSSWHSAWDSVEDGGPAELDAYLG